MSRPFASAWRRGRLLDDALFAEAYESLGGGDRALLKLAIARLYRVFGESPRAESLTRHFDEGFALHMECRPADWALVACQDDCPSPAALLAVILPALLAGVDSLCVCFCPGAKAGATNGTGNKAGATNGTDPGPLFAPLAAALELAGVEEASMAGADELAAELEGACCPPRSGRVVCLGEAAFFEPLALAALRRETPFMLLPASPAYFNSRLDLVVRQHFRSGGPASGVPDAGPAPGLEEEAVRAALDADHEEVWIWPELSPDWFRGRRLKLFTENRS